MSYGKYTHAIGRVVDVDYDKGACTGVSLAADHAVEIVSGVFFPGRYASVHRPPSSTVRPLKSWRIRTLQYADRYLPSADGGTVRVTFEQDGLQQPAQIGDEVRQYTYGQDEEEAALIQPGCRACYGSGWLLRRSDPELDETAKSTLNEMSVHWLRGLPLPLTWHNEAPVVCAICSGKGYF